MAGMQRDTPLPTFWSIIGMTLAALVVTHLLKMPGDKAMPVFIVFMLLGVPLGELFERMSKRSQAK
ncbi:MAG: hypothetical protein HY236_03070 [Acidobacteria bacterium]|nr:hypothetical protein [Acidobacteriota bacterium]